MTIEQGILLEDNKYGRGSWYFIGETIHLNDIHPMLMTNGTTFEYWTITCLGYDCKVKHIY